MALAVESQVGWTRPVYDVDLDVLRVWSEEQVFALVNTVASSKKYAGVDMKATERMWRRTSLLRRARDSLILIWARAHGRPWF